MCGQASGYCRKIFRYCHTIPGLLVSQHVSNRGSVHFMGLSRLYTVHYLFDILYLCILVHHQNLFEGLQRVPSCGPDQIKSKQASKQAILSFLLVMDIFRFFTALFNGQDGTCNFQLWFSPALMGFF